MAVEEYITPAYMKWQAPESVYLALPMGSRNIDIGAAEAWQTFMSCHPEAYNIMHAKAMGECTYNSLWCAAVNKRKTHPILRMNKFAMIHTDIHPEWYWLDKLWALINRSKADIITACPALKGEGRYTTVGISSPDMEDPVRWLTFDQLKQLPDPFFIEDIDHKKGEVLCMNTGLWIADITKPWAKIIDWSSIAWIDETKEGLLNPRFVSEDYKVSKVLASHLTTIRIGGTFSIKIDHHGSKPFTNR